MCCPVNMYCDHDISGIVIVTYHVLISAQFVSYVVSIPWNLISGNDPYDRNDYMETRL